MNRHHCESIRAKLKKNGGPLATEAADCIGWLLDQFAEPRRGEIHPNHQAIVLLFQKRLNKPFRDPKEVRAYEAIAKLITSEDLANLKRFYRLPDPKAFHKFLSRRKTSPITLMRSWVDQCELAEEWATRNPPPKDSTKPEIPEPKDWQPHAPGNLGRKSWHQVCREYPDLAKQISGTVNAACKPSE